MRDSRRLVKGAAAVHVILLEAALGFMLVHWVLLPTEHLTISAIMGSAVVVQYISVALFAVAFSAFLLMSWLVDGWVRWLLAVCLAGAAIVSAAVPWTLSPLTHGTVSFSCAFFAALYVLAGSASMQLWFMTVVAFAFTAAVLTVPFAARAEALGWNILGGVELAAYAAWVNFVFCTHVVGKVFLDVREI